MKNKKLCKIEGCTFPVEIKSFCKKHYNLDHYKKHPEQYNDLAYKHKWRRTLEGMYSLLKGHAKNKGIYFSLSFEKFSQLRNMSCYYCKGVLPEAGGGIDRRDNSEGYTDSNSVSCCEICNKTKNKFLTEAEMLNLIAFREESVVAERMIGSCVL